MDYNSLTKLLNSEDVTHAEITTYHVKEDGSIIRKTVSIDYFKDGDYQWSTNTRPLNKKIL